MSQEFYEFLQGLLYYILRFRKESKYGFYGRFKC